MRPLPLMLPLMSQPGRGASGAARAEAAAAFHLAAGSVAGADGAAAQEIRQMLIARKLKTQEERLYAPIRARAVIVRR